MNSSPSSQSPSSQSPLPSSQSPLPSSQSPLPSSQSPSSLLSEYYELCPHDQRIRLIEFMTKQTLLENTIDELSIALEEFGVVYKEEYKEHEREIRELKRLNKKLQYIVNIDYVIIACMLCYLTLNF